MIWGEAPAVTTEDDEADISASVMAPQWVTHRRRTRTLENHKGCGTRICYLQWAVRE
jgi:hypothetical protein